MSKIPRHPGDVQGVPPNLLQFPLPWARLSPLAKTILGSDEAQQHYTWVYPVAIEMARLTHCQRGARQVFTEAMQLWAKAKEVREHVGRMVGYAWKEERNNLKNKPAEVFDTSQLSKNGAAVYTLFTELQPGPYLPFEASLSMISTLTELHRTSVTRALTELKSRGVVTVDNVKDRVKPGVGYVPMVYRLVPPSEMA